MCASRAGLSRQGPAHLLLAFTVCSVVLCLLRLSNETYAMRVPSGDHFGDSSARLPRKLPVLESAESDEAEDLQPG